MRFVLVHGAMHGAWCWDRVVHELEQRGHVAEAVDLPRHDTRDCQASTLARYRDAVVAAMRGEDVLVGHSLGAGVVTMAADARPDLVGHITLLAGPLPVEGYPLSYQKTAASVGGSASEAAEEGVADEHIRFTPDGSEFYFDRDGMYATFYHDCDQATVDWAMARLANQPLSALLEPVSVPRFWEADLPRSYVICQRDRTFPPRTARLQAQRMGVRPLEIDSSHAPFLSRPAELAETLVQATTTTPIGALVSGELVPPAPAAC